MRVAGLFAGVGGIELGLERAGFETALLCESDPAARAVLRRRFAGLPIHDDVRQVDKLPRTIDTCTSSAPIDRISF